MNIQFKSGGKRILHEEQKEKKKKRDRKSDCRTKLLLLILIVSYFFISRCLVFFTGRQVPTYFYFIFKRSSHYLASTPLKTHPLAIRYAVSNRCVYTHLPTHLHLHSIYTYTAADQVPDPSIYSTIQAFPI